MIVRLAVGLTTWYKLDQSDVQLPRTFKHHTYLFVASGKAQGEPAVGSSLLSHVPIHRVPYYVDSRALLGECGVSVSKRVKQVRDHSDSSNVGRLYGGH